MKNILILNGPNLNLLGEREPEVYGYETLTTINAKLTEQVKHAGYGLVALQSNAEHVLVDKIHKAKTESVVFILINPGALTHTSIALRDAFLGVSLPFIEVHLSNVFSRETFRHKSYLSDIAVGCVIGLGAKGYELAMTAALAKLENQ